MKAEEHARGLGAAPTLGAQRSDLQLRGAVAERVLPPPRLLQHLRALLLLHLLLVLQVCDLLVLVFHLSVVEKGRQIALFTHRPETADSQT